MKKQSQKIEKQDFRGLSSSAREALRKRGIALIKSGKKKCDVAILLGTNNTTISNWCKSYKTKGNKGLLDKKRGAKSENCKSLTVEQEVAIQKMIVPKFLK